MSVDLSEVGALDALRRAVNPPGQTVVTIGDDEALGRLQDGFWDARLDGLLSNFTVDDEGVITPLRGTTDIDREEVQIVVFYAAYNALYSRLMNLNTQFRAQAGPVTYEVQQSANMLRDVAAMLKERKALILSRLAGFGATNTYYIDSVIERTDSLLMGLTDWIAAGSGARGFGD